MDETVEVEFPNNLSLLSRGVVFLIRGGEEMKSLIGLTE